jgi:hypothetical protein
MDAMMFRPKETPRMPEEPGARFQLTRRSRFKRGFDWKLHFPRKAYGYEVESRSL